MPRLTKEQDEARVKALFAFDEKIANEVTGNKDAVILGIDEVGRGPVAGPLAAGGVVWKSPTYVQHLNDSKKITEKRRPIVASQIKEKALFSCVEFVEASVIDEIGIAESLKRAFRAVIDRCEEARIVPDIILIDGNKIDVDKRVKTVVKGDAKSASIAAASVIAKVERDDLMVSLSAEFPDYKWEKNKGYGTKDHLDAIKQFGMTVKHRRTFLKKFH